MAVAPRSLSEWFWWHLSPRPSRLRWFEVPQPLDVRISLEPPGWGRGVEQPPVHGAERLLEETARGLLVLLGHDRRLGAPMVLAAVGWDFAARQRDSACSETSDVHMFHRMHMAATRKVVQTELDPALYEFVLRTAKAKGLTLKEAALEALRRWAPWRATSRGTLSSTSPRRTAREGGRTPQEWTRCCTARPVRGLEQREGRLSVLNDQRPRGDSQVRRADRACGYGNKPLAHSRIVPPWSSPPASSRRTSPAAAAS